jgi:hypothetical protein
MVDYQKEKKNIFAHVLPGAVLVRLIEWSATFKHGVSVWISRKGKGNEKEGEGTICSVYVGFCMDISRWEVGRNDRM